MTNSKHDVYSDTSKDRRTRGGHDRFKDKETRKRMY